MELTKSELAIVKACAEETKRLTAALEVERERRIAAESALEILRRELIPPALRQATPQRP